MADADLCGLLYTGRIRRVSGGGIFELCLVVEELSKICSGISLAIAATGPGHVPHPPLRHRREKKYLPDIAAGKILAALRSPSRKPVRTPAPCAPPPFATATITC